MMTYLMTFGLLVTFSFPKLPLLIFPTSQSLLQSMMAPLRYDDHDHGCSPQGGLEIPAVKETMALGAERRLGEPRHHNLHALKSRQMAAARRPWAPMDAHERPHMGDRRPVELVPAAAAAGSNQLQSYLFSVRKYRFTWKKTLLEA